MIGGHRLAWRPINERWFASGRWEIGTFRVSGVNPPSGRTTTEHLPAYRRLIGISDQHAALAMLMTTPGGRGRNNTSKQCYAAITRYSVDALLLHHFALTVHSSMPPCLPRAADQSVHTTTNPTTAAPSQPPEGESSFASFCHSRPACDLPH